MVKINDVSMRVWEWLNKEAVIGRTRIRRVMVCLTALLILTAALFALTLITQRTTTQARPGVVPTPTVNKVVVSVVNYVSEESISDATVKIGEESGTYYSSDKIYGFTNLPAGEYNLRVGRSGFNTYVQKISVDYTSSKEQKLEQISLVPEGRVVFESNRDGGKRGIYSANYDGSDQKAVVPRVGQTEDSSPVLNSNQSKIYFFSTRDNKKDSYGSLQTATYFITAEGLDLKKVSDDTQVKWSPDGRYIGFIENGLGNRQRLNTFDTTNYSFKDFTNYSLQNGYTFAFSLDGSEIAFSGTQDGVTNSSGLFKGQSNGQTIQLVDNVYARYLEFSPAKLRYSAFDTNKYYEYDLVSGAKQEISVPTLPSTTGLLSYDKKYLAYVSNRDGKSNLFISDPNGRNEQKLTSLDSVTGNLLWSKDSSFIMFNYQTLGESGRYLVSINGKTPPKKITDISSAGYL